MSRTYTPVDIVTLPRADASDTVALVRSLETAARGRKRMPPTLTRAMVAMLARCTELENERATRLGPAASAADASLADQNIDAAYSGTFGLLTSWTKLTTETAATHIETAQKLLDQLFPDGLKFTQLPYRQQWAESRTRLLRIEREKLDADFALLGGTLFLDAIRTTHAAYGEALGITELAPEGGPTAKVRESLQSTHAALRTYVLKVIAQIEPDDPTSQELADALLQPLTNWKSRAGSSTPSEDETVPDTQKPIAVLPPEALATPAITVSGSREATPQARM